MKTAQSIYLEHVSIRHVTSHVETSQPHQKAARILDDDRMYYNIFLVYRMISRKRQCANIVLFRTKYPSPHTTSSVIENLELTSHYSLTQSPTLLSNHNIT
jgi:hypothetical protein